MLLLRQKKSVMWWTSWYHISKRLKDKKSYQKCWKIPLRKKVYSVLHFPLRKEKNIYTNPFGVIPTIWREHIILPILAWDFWHGTVLVVVLLLVVVCFWALHLLQQQFSQFCSIPPPPKTAGRRHRLQLYILPISFFGITVCVFYLGSDIVHHRVDPPDQPLLQQSSFHRRRVKHGAAVLFCAPN